MPNARWRSIFSNYCAERPGTCPEVWHMCIYRCDYKCFTPDKAQSQHGHAVPLLLTIILLVWNGQIGFLNWEFMPDSHRWHQQIEGLWRRYCNELLLNIQLMPRMSAHNECWTGHRAITTDSTGGFYEALLTCLIVRNNQTLSSSSQHVWVKGKPDSRKRPGDRDLRERWYCDHRTAGRNTAIDVIDDMCSARTRHCN